MTERDIAKLRKFSRFVFPFDFPRKEEEIETIEKQIQILLQILKSGDEKKRNIIQICLHFLDIYSFFSEGGDFLSLDEYRTQRVILRMSKSEKKIIQNTFRILRFVSTLSFWDAFGNHKVGFSSDGKPIIYDIPKIEWEFPPEPQEIKFEGSGEIKWDIERIRFGKFIRRDIRIVSDVIIVGSGVSACMIAERLSREDISVSILEKGYFQDTDFPSIYLAQSSEMLSLFPVSGLTNTNALFGRGVGGLANLSFSIFERMGDKTKEKWRKYHGISTKDIMFDDAVKLAEEIINSRAKGENNSKSNIIEKISNYLGLPHKNFRKLEGDKINLITGEKILPLEKFVKYAVHFGANLYVGFEVERIYRNRKWFLEGKVKDEFGNTKANFLAEAKAVFLCAGPYGNTKILMNSNFKEKTLGKKVKINPAGIIIGIFNSPQNQIDSSNYIEFEKEEIMAKEVRFAPGVWSSLKPQAEGKELVSLSKKYPFAKTILFWFREEGESFFVKTPFGLVLRSNLKGEDIAKFIFAIKQLSLALIFSGAREVIHPIRNIPSFEKVEDVENLNIEKIKPSYIEMISLFPVGGCSMSFTSERGFVDSTGRVFGEKSLFICDTSALPDSTEVPPMLSTAAIAQICVSSFLERKRFIL